MRYGMRMQGAERDTLVDVEVGTVDMAEFPVAVTIGGSTHLGSYTITQDVIISSYGKHRASAPLDVNALGTARALLRRLVQRTMPPPPRERPITVHAVQLAASTSRSVSQVYPVIVCIGFLGWAWSPYLETAIMPATEFSNLSEIRPDRESTVSPRESRGGPGSSGSVVGVRHDLPCAAPIVEASTVGSEPERARASLSGTISQQTIITRTFSGRRFVLSKTFSERGGAAAPRMVKAAAREVAHDALQVPLTLPTTPEPPVAVTAPPLPFTYFGRLETGDEVHVFLRQGERDLSIKAGDQIDEIYRVERIDANSIVFTYIPSQTQQILSVSGAPALAATPAPESIDKSEVIGPNVPRPAAEQIHPLASADTPGV